MGNPLQTLAGNIRWYFMIAVKLTEGDVIAASFQSRSDATTATVNRQNVVLSAMRNEDAWLTLWPTVNDEARRKSDYLTEKITIDQTER
jgi:hypothetical protein